MSIDAEDQIVGVILAGGASRRMGGAHKGLLNIADKPMIQHVAERLPPGAGTGDQRAWRGGRVSQVRRAADLRRLRRAAWAAGGRAGGHDVGEGGASQARWIATASCDAPFCPRDYVDELLGAALASPANGARIAIAASDGRRHFAFGLWPVALSADLSDYLAAGERRMQGWIGRHSHVMAEFSPLLCEGQPLDPFFNVNTPDDLAKAEKCAAVFLKPDPTAKP